MKDIFKKRCNKEFISLMKDFSESMEENFPECSKTKEWCLWFRNVVSASEKEMMKTMEDYEKQILTPLPKKSMKYGKAIHFITGKQALVYHAMAYRDMKALKTVGLDHFSSLEVEEKLASEKMKGKNTDIFWQYIHEMNKKCLEASRTETPVVPTPKEIDENISARRLASSSSVQSAPSSDMIGLKGWWKNLLASRESGEEGRTSDEEVVKKLTKIYKEKENCVSLIESKDEAFLSEIRGEFPELGQEPFDEDQVSTLHKCFQLVSMNESLPPGVMNGIEKVASQLMEDITSGKASLESMDIEEIGKKVLGEVSSTDLEKLVKSSLQT
jgi:hypothetical protein